MRNDRRRSRFRAAGPSAAAVFALWLCAASLFGASPERSFVLDNGLRVFLYEKHDVPLVNIVCGFDVGSKNETEATSGLVHLLEHCVLFRGTQTRSGRQVVADIRRHGAYFNGNTSQDLAVFEISLPADQADFGLRNQKDILFGLALTQADIEEEKSIILEELGQMEDDPERSAVDLVLQDLFRGHPYGRSVYGRREVIQAATSETLGAFYRKYFVADNCAMAIVGDLAVADMEARVREVFGSLPKTGFEPESFPPAAPLMKSSSRRLERDVREGYLYIAFASPDYNSPDLYAVNVLVEALGRGINPLLGGYLRGLRDSVQNVLMVNMPLRYGGAAVLSVRCDPKDIAAVERAAVSFLNRVHNQSFSKKDFASSDEASAAFDYLEMAKNQIRFASGQAEESGLQLAGSLVRHMLLNTRPDPGRYLDRIEKVDSSDLRKMSSRYFSRGEYAAVSIVPLKEKAK
jgi:zinc protease